MCEATLPQPQYTPHIIKSQDNHPPSNNPPEQKAQSSKVRDRVPVPLLEVHPANLQLLSLLPRNLSLPPLDKRPLDVFAIAIRDTLDTQTTDFSVDELAAMRRIVTAAGKALLPVAVQLHAIFFPSSLDGEALCALFRAGVVVQVLAVISVQRAVTDGFSRGEVQFVFIVKDSV